jgi:hypothetical protein
MKRDEVFPSKYLKAADLDGKPAIVTIKTADLEVLKSTDGKEEAKIVLRFGGKKKCLPLNRINWDTVADILGDDTEDWPGGKIELYPTTTEMAGKTVDCVRIRKPSGELLLPAKNKAAPPSDEDPPLPSDDDIRDEIPF